MVRVLVLFAASLITAQPDSSSSSENLYVDGGVSHSGNGTIDHPFRTLGAAIASSHGRGIVHIVAGNYRENIGSAEDHPGERYVLRGGYRPGSRFVERDPAKFPSVITAADSKRPVVNVANADAVDLDGLRIEGGSQGIRASGWQSNRTVSVSNCVITKNGSSTNPVNGAGADLQARTVRFVNNRVEDNQGGQFGAAIIIGHAGGDRDATTEVRANIIRHNVAIGGGIHGAGIWLASSGRLDENVIDGNRMVSNDRSGPGGGVIIIGDGVHVTASRNLIVNNQAETSGGGIFVDEGASATLENNIIVHNRSGRGGSGVGVDGSTTKRGRLRIVNCTIADNGAGSEFGDGLSVENSDVEVVNTIFWANGPRDLQVTSGSTVAISCTNYGGTNPGANVKSGPGVQHLDPKFLSAKQGDYHLGPKSPMIGSGCAGATPALDFYGRERRAGIADLGAVGPGEGNR